MMLLDGILCIAAGLILGTGIGWVVGWRSYNDKMAEILEDYIREKEQKDKGGEKSDRQEQTQGNNERDGRGNQSGL